jgi:succinyl-diaminopimelate desuccinylase
MSDTDLISFCQQLLRCPSITPDDAGCMALITPRLEALGFKITRLDHEGVSNLWAHRGRGHKPIMLFAGHTDVVPVSDGWQHPPFDAVIQGDTLHGRGSQDMKTALAAMLHATEAFLDKHPEPNMDLAWLLTSDEEGPAQHGTQHVAQWLKEHDIIPAWCLVGEPTSSKAVGDTIKVGRRGSLHLELTLQGKAGHIAYPEQGRNPIHKGMATLHQLAHTTWDQGNAHFQPTHFQWSHLASSSGAENVTPATLTARGNFRFSPESCVDTLKQQCETQLNALELPYTAHWRLSGLPFYAPQSALLDAACRAIKTTQGFEPKLSTGGGTSDGRFLAPLGIRVMELGLLNNRIHQVDECSAVQAVHQLKHTYTETLEQLNAHLKAKPDAL